MSIKKIPEHQLETVITSDGCKICFDSYANGHRHVVIIAHGFFNSKDALLLKELGKELLDDYDVVIVDFRGHGGSPGFFYWTTKEYLDLQAVVDHSFLKYDAVGVVGFSLGAATSIITASQTDKIKSLVAVSAPTDFQKIEYHFWELDIENDILFSLVGEGRYGKGVRPGPFWLKKERPIDRMDKVQAPTLFIHGDRDWLIYPRHSRELYQKARCVRKLAIIKNGPHAEYLIRKNKQETIFLIKDWFKKTF
ncbi:MAG: alpha/beta fold hydrolase [Candidatus Omnitrophica bacterium]|nr:alpha/beta fold hydrolase [Candidatus Omnitrophota bacterium]